MNLTNNKFPLDNYLGCLLGGAIGDALGAPIEFLHIEDIINRYGSSGITDFVEFSNNVGEFTDDTQMTLFTAEGLLRALHREVLKGIGGASSFITHKSYLRWLLTQGRVVPTDKSDNDLKSGWLITRKELFRSRAPGNTCISSLKSGIMGTIENPFNVSKGCGGVMRMAPVGLLFFESPETSFRIGCELAAITHGHPSGYLSAGFFASIISQLAVGMRLEDAISKSMEELTKWENHEETLTAVESAVSLWKETKSPDGLDTLTLSKKIEQLGDGWVGEEALAISIFCSLLFQDDFTGGVLASVNHSGDCDSTGAITGNILGLIHGKKSIPQKWIDNLRYSEIVSEVAEDLHIVCKSSTDDCDEEWWNKYPGY